MIEKERQNILEIDWKFVKGLDLDEIGKDGGWWRMRREPWRGIAVCVEREGFYRRGEWKVGLGLDGDGTSPLCETGRLPMCLPPCIDTSVRCWESSLPIYLQHYRGTFPYGPKHLQFISDVQIESCSPVNSFSVTLMDVCRVYKLIFTILNLYS